MFQEYFWKKFTKNNFVFFLEYPVEFCDSILNIYSLILLVLFYGNKMSLFAGFFSDYIFWNKLLKIITKNHWLFHWIFLCISSYSLRKTFVRIIVSGVCWACHRKLISDTKYEKKKNFCQRIRQQKFFFFHLLMN